MNRRQLKHDTIFNFKIAMDAVMANKLRSLLTALGIIFGVAAVIAMMAIGNGAQQEILKQIKLVGVNNIVIQPLEKKPSEENPDEKKEKKKFSPGLTLDDARAIKEILPGIQAVSPEIILNTTAIRNSWSASVKLIGVSPDFFSMYNFKVTLGSEFNSKEHLGEGVCIIGKGIQKKFFATSGAIGKYLKVGSHWLQIVGVLEERKVAESSMNTFGIRNFDMDIYTPLQTMLLRYVNRSLVTAGKLVKGNDDDDDESTKKSQVSTNQLDRLVVQCSKTELLNASSEVIGRLLKRRHNNVEDFEITIPELLLKQQQKTKDIFNMVLAAIASISLVVGGIGIMNIMLASVLERIKEIGIRLSIGATKDHIILQFLCEAVFISVIGGIIGIICGIGLSFIIGKITGILTIISITSILISFGVSAGVGLVFGIMPARKAALQDPIKSLRYE